MHETTQNMHTATSPIVAIKRVALLWATVSQLLRLDDFSVVVDAYVFQQKRHSLDQRSLSWGAFRSSKSYPFAFITPTKTTSFSLSSSSSDNNDADDDISRMMESFRNRQQEIEKQQYVLDQKWRNADCVSNFKAELPDWIRRLDVGEYPLAACGSAAGTIYAVNLETGKILAHSSSKSSMLRRTNNDNNNSNEEEEEPISSQLLDETIEALYMEYDGGGTIAVAMYKTLICSAGRDGSVQIHRYDPQSSNLIFQGSMIALKGALITTLSLDDSFLWVGTADGRVLSFEHHYNSNNNNKNNVIGSSSSSSTNDNNSNDKTEKEEVSSLLSTQLILQREPYQEWNLPLLLQQQEKPPEPKSSLYNSLLSFVSSSSSSSSSSSAATSNIITSLSLNNDIGYGVATTVDGGVMVLDMEDEDRGILAKWTPEPFLASSSYARCAIIGVYHGSYSIFCGGSDGSVHVRTLASFGELEEDLLCLSSAATATIGNNKRFSSSSSSSSSSQEDDPDNCETTSSSSSSRVDNNKKTGGDGFVLFQPPTYPLAVSCMVCPPSPLELLVTGSKDGSIRVFDVSEETPTNLYSFVGYKVWLGSLWTDGTKLLSDGSDNSIIVHDFETEEEEEENKKKEDDSSSSGMDDGDDKKDSMDEDDQDEDWL